MLVFTYFRPQAREDVKKPNPAELMDKAGKALNERNYKEAINAYGEAAKRLDGTQDGAQALLQLARVQRDARGKAKNEHAAVETFRRLITDYGPKRYPEVAQARAEMLALRVKMDRDNRNHWLYRTMDALVRFSKNLGLRRYSYAFALLLITLIVKLLTWKLSAIQYKGMKDMQRVQPLLKQVQEKYKGNPKELNAKVMETYKKEGVNPLMGCLPMLVQFPILIFVYQAIQKYAFQFENGIFLWINGYMSQHYGLAISKVFAGIPILGAISKQPFFGANLAQPDIPLVILYTISMFITQKLTVVDPSQAQQQKMMTILMPIMFMFLFWRLPSAFLLYWLMLNVVMTAHQYYVIRQPTPAPALVEAPAKASRAAGSRRKRRR